MQRLALFSSLLLPFALCAQPKAGGPSACQLLSAAEVARVTGQSRPADPIPSGTTGCIWENVQLQVLTGNLEQRLDTMTKSFGQAGAKPVPISGVGEKAMSFAPEPRDKYDDRAVYVVVKQGAYLVQASMLVPKGQTAQAVQPKALDLAKLALTKLK